MIFIDTGPQPSQLLPQASGTLALQSKQKKAGMVARLFRINPTRARDVCACPAWRSFSQG